VNQRRRERRAEARRRRDEGRRAAEALGITNPGAVKTFLEARERQYQNQHLVFATALPVTNAHIMAASPYPGSYPHRHPAHLNQVYRAAPFAASVSPKLEHGAIPAIVPQVDLSAPIQSHESTTFSKHEPTEPGASESTTQ
jgi:hypothetical protein